jgi:NAD(P)-dependent dehydrogenase (short-subunit alcohol dehydrogenase family)
MTSSAPATAFVDRGGAMNPRIRHWKGARVWVIGASTGIGAATATLLLSKGARVALSARNASALQTLADNNLQALVLPLDITQHADVQKAHEHLLSAWGGIDIVLIVAGVYNEMRADSIDMVVVNQVLDINLRGTFNCIDVVLPTLLKQSYGGIGIVSSVAGFSGLPKALVYGPSKAALINLCESLYFDLSRRGNSVYLINPGFVKTPATANNDFVMPGLISADEAAREILSGMERGQFHIHFPKRFTNWLRLARLLPYRWYFYLIHKVTGL